MIDIYLVAYCQRIALCAWVVRKGSGNVIVGWSFGGSLFQLGFTPRELLIWGLAFPLKALFIA
jgi:hypothetical protein